MDRSCPDTPSSRFHPRSLPPRSFLHSTTSRFLPFRSSAYIRRLKTCPRKVSLIWPRVTPADCANAINVRSTRDTERRNVHRSQPNVRRTIETVIDRLLRLASSCRRDLKNPKREREEWRKTEAHTCIGCTRVEYACISRALIVRNGALNRVFEQRKGTIKSAEVWRGG